MIAQGKRERWLKMKKAMGMFAALILALGMSGIAYAHWSKVITISGTVNTGTLHLIPTFEFDSLVQVGGKPIAEVNSNIDLETNTITVTMDNVYPCLWVYGTFDLHNNGTIPAGLHAINVTAENLVVNYWPIAGGYAGEVEDNSLDPGENVIMTGQVILSGDGESDFDQIDPGDNVYADFSLHFTENLPQNTTYTFTIELVYYNWNEA